MKTSWIRSLGVLQAFCLATLAGVLVLGIKLYHFETEDVWVPFWRYLGSLRLAVPPVLALIVSYLLLFIGGVSLGEVPRVTLAFFRNTFFQRRWIMGTVCAAGLVFMVAAAWHMRTSPPPAYARLAAQLLGGEGDDHKIVEERLKALREVDLGRAEQLEVVRRVFVERSDWNFGKKQPETTTPRIFVRTLETNLGDENWRRHPLRWHALAEAYSMWSQAAFGSSYREDDDDDWRTLRKKCLEYYRLVETSGDPRAIPLMRFSAIQNSGNACYYTQDYDLAVAFYTRVMKKNKNLSTAGNLIAVELLRGVSRVEEVISFGEEIREWALIEGKALSEVSPYSSVLVGLGFAHCVKGEFALGRRYFREAFDIMPDELNGQSLAAAFILEGRPRQALAVLDSLKQPVIDAKTHLDVVPKLPAPAHYLFRALALPAEDVRGRGLCLLAYLGRPTPQAALESLDSATEKALRQEAMETARTSGGLEKDLLLISGFSRLFE